MAEEQTVTAVNRRSSCARRHRSRGSVLVEMAMVLFPLMTITLGIVEIGAAWKDKSAAVQASRQGARVVTSSSVANPDDGIYLSDQQALLGVLAGIPTDSGGAAIQIRKVIIYDATISDADLDQCKAIGESGAGPEIMPRDNQTGLGENGKCNVYLAGNDPGFNSLDRNTIRDNPGFFNGSSWDAEFDPDSDRSGAIGTATEVGVFVELYRPYITGLIPGEGMKISGFTVMRIEPAGL